MALYTNIAGFNQVGLVQDAYFVRPEEGSYSQDGYYPSGGGGYYEPIATTSPVQISSETGGFYTLQPTATVDPLPGTVFYDPGFVEPYVTPVALPADGLTTYQERQSVPVTPILQIDAPVDTVVPDGGGLVVTADQVQTEVPAADQGKRIFPLLALGLVFTVILKGESIFGNKRSIAFGAGLGALYLQMKQPA